jgi:hypothetical protein
MTDDLDPNDVAVVNDPAPEPKPDRAGRRRKSLPVMAGLSDAADRSPDPETCPFLRSVDAVDAIGPPIEVPDPLNRCLAIDQPTPQSERQQEIVCLTAGHVNCPRYLRGAVASHHAAAVPVARQAPSSPVLASVIVLVLSAAASVGFLLMRGGMALALPSASPDSTPGASEVAVVPPSPTDAPPSLVPTPSPPATPAVTASPSSTLEPPPSASAEPSPPPTPAATPTSNRYDVLVACPDAPDCWIYTVRAGDNFQSIVNWFGVPYDTVIAMNPGMGDPGTIHVGDRIRMPPPTR